MKICTKVVDAVFLRVSGAFRFPAFCLHYVLLSVLLYAAVSCSKQDMPVDEIVFEPCSSLSTGRAAAGSFSAGGSGFVFGGRLPDGSYTNELWKFTPDASGGKWTLMGTPPLTARVHPVAVVLDGNAYVGLGYGGGGPFHDDSYCRDFWRFSPVTGEWKRLADYPTKNTDAAVSFAIDGKIYVGLGNSSFFAPELFCYIPEEDKWVECAGEGFMSLDSVYLTDGRSCFAGWGYADKNVGFWAEYLPSEDRWVKKKRVSRWTRTGAACLSSDGRMYVMGGYNFGGTMTDGFRYSDITEYVASSDKWILRGHLPQGPCEAMVSFAIDGYGYVGLGENAASGTPGATAVRNDFYKFKL